MQTPNKFELSFNITTADYVNYFQQEIVNMVPQAPELDTKALVESLDIFDLLG